MLPDFLSSFNDTLDEFNTRFPRQAWTKEFKNDLINDYSFYSARIEDAKLQYGDTIRFLNNEVVRLANLSSLFGITEQQALLTKLIDSLDNASNFVLSEELIKQLHQSLMESPFAWQSDFRPELVGNYRNIPVVGLREPFFEDKDYCSHFNLEVVMPSHIDIFNNRIRQIDNSKYETHLLTMISFFHNKFLNELHPFADGNGRVCRVIIGGILMANNCPPIFPQIINEEQQVEYITKIVECEKSGDDKTLVEYFANGMAEYLRNRLQ